MLPAAADADPRIAYIQSPRFVYSAFNYDVECVIWWIEWISMYSCVWRRGRLNPTIDVLHIFRIFSTRKKMVDGHTNIEHHTRRHSICRALCITSHQRPYYYIVYYIIISHLFDRRQGVVTGVVMMNDHNHIIVRRVCVASNKCLNRKRPGGYEFNESDTYADRQTNTHSHLCQQWMNIEYVQSKNCDPH